mmetsp:Transcript_8774/g.22997  ORF Transcript_8774/g.22997 Transcript_8774/m.22997 type:complete len:98 (+) Transcript_8774:604-897(+)
MLKASEPLKASSARIGCRNAGVEVKLAKAVKFIAATRWAYLSCLMRDPLHAKYCTAARNYQILFRIALRAHTPRVAVAPVGIAAATLLTALLTARLA